MWNPPAPRSRPQFKMAAAAAVKQQLEDNWSNSRQHNVFPLAPLSQQVTTEAPERRLCLLDQPSGAKACRKAAGATGKSLFLAQLVHVLRCPWAAVHLSPANPASPCNSLDPSCQLWCSRQPFNAGKLGSSCAVMPHAAKSEIRRSLKRRHRRRPTRRRRCCTHPLPCSPTLALVCRRWHELLYTVEAAEFWG